MKDILGEERVLQPSEVELQNSRYGIHVVVVLVPRQWVFPFATSKEKQARKIRRKVPDWRDVPQLKRRIHAAQS